MPRALAARRLPQLADARVLVVDDSAAIHGMLQDCLEAFGCPEVYHAGSAREAVTFYGAMRPDLVLSDLLMPGVTGAAFTKELLARHPKARVVVVTALAPTHPYVVEAVAHGARAVVQKPFEPQRLAEAVKRAFDL